MSNAASLPVQSKRLSARRPSPGRRPLPPAEAPKPVAQPAPAVETSAPAGCASLDFEGLAGSAMFEVLGRGQPRPPRGPLPAISIAAARGYAKQDLWALAEMGYHYLRCGGYRLAQVIFEGLAAVDPSEPYYALALGLAEDHLGDKGRAADWYTRALELDPQDPRAELNLAELALEEGKRARAENLIRRAHAKAWARKDAVLCKKAEALLSLMTAAKVR